MEQQHTLTAADGAKIYAVLNTAATDGTRGDKLLVMVHGLGGSIYSGLNQEARRYFAKQGYDVLRIKLYSDEEDARTLRECTLQTHVSDVKQFFEAFSSDYTNSYAVGHSYGGLTLLLANLAVTAQSLWDASYGLAGSLAHVGEEQKHVFEEHGFVMYAFGTDLVIGKDMYEERKILTDEFCQDLAQKMKRPTQVCTAQKGILVDGAQCYFDALSVAKDYKCISNATHNFAEGDTAFDLYKATDNWFKKVEKS